MLEAFVELTWNEMYHLLALVMVIILHDSNDSYQIVEGKKRTKRRCLATAAGNCSL